MHGMMILAAIEWWWGPSLERLRWDGPRDPGGLGLRGPNHVSLTEQGPRYADQLCRRQQRQSTILVPNVEQVPAAARGPGGGRLERGIGCRHWRRGSIETMR
jgi:hypothetical protein